MEKMIINGDVAVLYSPGFGAGWSTWNSSDAEGVEWRGISKEADHHA